jgi:hypothetical protein
MGLTLAQALRGLFRRRCNRSSRGDWQTCLGSRKREEDRSDAKAVHEAAKAEVAKLRYVIVEAAA